MKVCSNSKNRGWYISALQNSSFSNSQRIHRGIYLVVNLSYRVFLMWFNWEKLNIHTFSEISLPPLYVVHAGLPAQYSSPSFYPSEANSVQPQSHVSWMRRIFQLEPKGVTKLYILSENLNFLCRICISRLLKPWKYSNLAKTAGVIVKERINGLLWHWFYCRLVWSLVPIKGNLIIRRLRSISWGLTNRMALGLLMANEMWSLRVSWMTFPFFLSHSYFAKCLTLAIPWRPDQSP